MSISPSNALNKSLVNQNSYDSTKITQTIVIIGQADVAGDFRGVVTKSDGSVVNFAFEVREQSPYPTIDLDLSSISNGDGFVIEKDGFIQVHSSEDTEETFAFSIERPSQSEEGDVETLLSNSLLRHGNSVIIIALQPGVYKFEDQTTGSSTAIRILHPTVAERNLGQRAATEETEPFVLTVLEDSIDPDSAEVMIGTPLMFNVIDGSRIVGALERRTLFDPQNKSVSDVEVERPGEGKIL